MHQHLDSTGTSPVPEYVDLPIQRVLADTLTKATQPIGAGRGHILRVDFFLASTASLLAVFGYQPVLVDLCFLGVLTAALRLPVRPLAIRAGLTGLATSTALVFGVLKNDVSREQLWDIPLFGIGILLAFAFSAEQARTQRELERARTRMLAGVSHDIRNPLAAASGLAEILADVAEESGDETLEVGTATIRHAVHEALALVDDLMTATRIEGGVLSTRIDVVDLAEIAEACAVQHSSPDAPVVLDGIEGPARGLGDGIRIRQVIRNLISNARRYGGPNVAVAAGARGDVAWIRVIDDGPGVPLGTEEKMFEAYSQVGSSQHPSESAGLGLANSRELARLMDGDLRYVRESGYTVFELTVPRADASSS